MNFGCKLLCSVKKTRARTGSRLMSVSAPGRVSFFARYRPSPKIGKSRSPPGGVRLYLAPLDRRSCQSLFTGRGSIWYSRSLYFFSLYIYFLFFTTHAIIIFVRSPSPFVSPLYFRAKGTTRSLRRARDARACT